jgi:hypothetical protein
MTLEAEEAPHPEVCRYSPCLKDWRRPYCQRCVIALKAELCPGMSARKIEAHLDQVSRTRALTERESVLLEWAIRSIATSERSAQHKRARRMAA